MSIPGLEIDHDSVVPVYRQIAEGIRAAANDGRLDAGRRLPPTRDLARQLGVNRNTVVAAYDELATEGWVRSHTGRGTFLTRPGSADASGEGSTNDEEEQWLSAFSSAVDAPEIGRLLKMYRHANHGEGISFAGSYPARELLPVAAFGESLARAATTHGTDALVYGPTAGHPPLREWIAARMRDRGSQIDASRVLVTSGAQQAIDLAFATFVERGDAVVIEEPTYTGALSVLASLGARVVGVPVDDRGMRTDLLEDALQRHRPRLIYVQPGCHNPTTAVMDVTRRRELLALAERHRCVIVEDDWASGLRFEGDDPPTLHALDGGRRVIHLDTFSKKLLPGLRLGWMSAPSPVMERLVAMKQIRDCGSSPLTQMAAHDFLERGGLERHLEQARPAYALRRDRMLAALERQMPRGTAWTRSRGGLFVWVTLPARVDGQELYLAAREQGIRYSRGDVFHSKVDGGNSLRLSFSVATPQQIDEGIARLGALIGERWPDGAEITGPAEAMPIL